MFKRGQLVRDFRGNVWVVESELSDGYFEILHPTKPRFNVLHCDDLILVGNNYQPKTNTPAR